MVIKHTKTSQRQKIEIAWRGKPSVGENGGWEDIYEKSESPFIRACGPHFLSFSLSVLTQCGTHALVRCVTNEGVLTFRCFPSKSQLRNSIHVSTEKEKQIWICSVQHVYVPMFFQRIFIYTRPPSKSSAITWRVCSEERTKGLFHFKLRENRSRCESFMKAVLRQADKPQRDTWDVCEMFVLSLLWFMSLNHLDSVFLQF